MKCGGGCCSSRDQIGTVMAYLQRWPFGRLVERAPDETLTRDEMHARVLQRAFADPALYDELRSNPRMVYMIALDEALGIDKLDYLCQIQEVRLLDELPGLLYLVLPACHYGCQSEGVTPPPADSHGACHVCGTLRTMGQAACDIEPQPDHAGAATPRATVERAMLRRAKLESSFRNALIFKPIATYTAFATAFCGGVRPAYLDDVGEIRVLQESDASICFIVPPLRVDHQAALPARRLVQPVGAD